MVTIEQRKKEFLDLIGIDVEDKNLIESRLKEILRKDDVDVKTWNFLFRGASLYDIDLSPEVKRIEDEKRLKELYDKKGTTIFTMLSTKLSMDEQEIRTLPLEKVLDLADTVVSSGDLSVKEHNIVCRGMWPIEKYIESHTEPLQEEIEKSKI